MIKKLSPLKSILLSITCWTWTALGTVLIVSFVSFPIWLGCLIFDRSKKNMPLHAVSRYWAKCMLAGLFFMRLRVEGQENLKRARPCILVCNHQSMLDIIAVLSAVSLPFKFIIKRELLEAPFLGWHLWMANYISVIRQDKNSGKQALLKGREYLRQGINLLFFPEGTRSLEDKIQEFKPGAFILATEEDTEIIPMVLCGVRPLLPKRGLRIDTAGTVTLKILKPVSFQESGAADVESFKNHIREQMIREYKAVKS